MGMYIHAKRNFQKIDCKSEQCLRLRNGPPVNNNWRGSDYKISFLITSSDSLGLQGLMENSVVAPFFD